MHQNRRKSSEKPLRSSLGFWITCCEDFGLFLRAFWEHFAPQSVSRNGKKNRSDFGGVPGGLEGSLGGPLWIRVLLTLQDWRILEPFLEDFELFLERILDTFRQFQSKIEK